MSGVLFYIIILSIEMFGEDLIWRMATFIKFGEMTNREERHISKNLSSQINKHGYIFHRIQL